MTVVFLLILLFALKFNYQTAYLDYLIAFVLLISAAGTALLVLKQEHRRRRSWWLLASFAGFLACTLVSLISGFPSP